MDYYDNYRPHRALKSKTPSKYEVDYHKLKLNN